MPSMSVRTPEDMDSDYMLQVYKEIGLVKNHPRLLIIISHSFIEMIVETLCEHHCPKTHLSNHNRKLEKLKKEHVIDEFQLKLYKWFLELRNKAAHNPTFRLKDSDFEPIANLIKKQQVGVNSLHIFSIKLISELWNKHLNVLVPVYLRKYC